MLMLIFVPARQPQKCPGAGCSQILNVGKDICLIHLTPPDRDGPDVNTLKSSIVHLELSHKELTERCKLLVARLNETKEDLLQLR